jgi:putative membrane protein
MRRLLALGAGASVLVLAWAGPLERILAGPFTAHMVAHLAVVAVAAPLVALAIAGLPFDPVRRRPSLFAPVPLSALELMVVWGWHAPMLHHAARSSAWMRALEQSSFLVAALLLWLSVLGGDPSHRVERRATGVLALLLTSMHMTLLGALLALPPRPLYQMPGDGPGFADALADQHLGGALMIAVGGVVYLTGGLALTLGLLSSSGAPTAARALEEGRT